MDGLVILLKFYTEPSDLTLPFGRHTIFHITRTPFSMQTQLVIENKIN